MNAWTCSFEHVPENMSVRLHAYVGPFTRAFMVRRCPQCGQIHLVKADWFVCAACDADLPRAWNFA